jgi:hypothetical protein
MAGHPEASHSVEAVEGFGASLPRRAVWDNGKACDTIPLGGSDASDPSKPGGFGVWARGSSGWVLGRNLRGVDGVRSGGDTRARCDDFVELRGMVTEGKKDRSVVNLSKQSKHWAKGSVRMETLPEYALEL